MADWLGSLSDGYIRDVLRRLYRARTHKGPNAAEMADSALSFATSAMMDFPGRHAVLACETRELVEVELQLIGDAHQRLAGSLLLLIGIYLEVRLAISNQDGGIRYLAQVRDGFTPSIVLRLHGVIVAELLRRSGLLLMRRISMLPGEPLWLEVTAPWRRHASYLRHPGVPLLATYIPIEQWGWCAPRFSGERR